MSTNESPAETVEIPTPEAYRAPTATQASWKQRATSELEKVVELFSSKELPDLCAKAMINVPERPSSKWSLGNQLLMLVAGTSDARGFRQWNEAGRWVAKGAKAFWILGPVRKKVKASEETVDEQGEPNGEGFKQILIGFKAIPVFRYEDTCGQDLPIFEPRDPPPLMEVAERFGMKVQYERLAPGMYGATDHTHKTIILASEDWDVFYHELGHAIHRSFEPKSGHGQESEAETIAQLVAATPARF